MRAGRVVAIVGVFVFLGSLVPVSTADGESGLWSPVAVAAHASGGPAWRIQPLVHRDLRLNRENLQALLDDAPLGGPGIVPAPGLGVQIELPLPDGRFAWFWVVEDPILDPVTAEAHPEIRTYALAAVDMPGTSGRMTWTPMGLYVALITPEGSVRIDPLLVGDAVTHTVYWRRDADEESEPFVCHTDMLTSTHQGLRMPGGAAFVTIGGTLHIYDECITTTPAYTSWAVTNAGSALAGVTATVNTANTFLQRDCAVRLNLVSDPDLFYDGTPNPPYTVDFTSNATVNAMLTGINNAIDAEIGQANYDVGHCFDLAGNGGVAFGSVVCVNGSKGCGYTSSGNPGAAIFQTRFAHETGHQFSAGHTWSSLDLETSSPGQFSASSGWEPGEGTTILSYGHVNGPDHIPGSVREDYYHGGTIEQITTFVNGTACDVEVATTNTPPSPTVPAATTIPKQTPFRLIGSATDAEEAAGALTYTWEEMDLAAAPIALTTVDDGVIPLFRSFFPTNGGSTRICPALTVLQNGSTFPTTTTPGVLGEQLPAMPRTDGNLAFRLTVRDNRAGSATETGGVNQADFNITVDTSGPFWVTAPNGGESWGESTVQTVTWSVNGTDVAPVSVANVKISMSTDGGATFPIVLLASTPNDGSENVTLPACNVTTQARIMVEAIGNIFFDISDADFSITDTTPPVVTCTVGRQVLWPASNGLLDILLTHSALDNCSTPTVSVLRVHSDEPNGAAPYTPDATIVGTTWRLRAQRAIPGNGRVYLCVVEYVDASLVPARDVCTAVVPAQLTVSSISAVLLDASVQRANCIAGGGLPPAGLVQLLSVP